jgi:hypothetical protein
MTIEKLRNSTCMSRQPAPITVILTPTPSAGHHHRHPERNTVILNSFQDLYLEAKKPDTEINSA